jgi:hypothetical protein
MNQRIGGMVATSMLGLLVVGGLFLALGERSAAQGPDGEAVYYVAPSCGGVPSPCYTEVQSAVDAVDDPGDVVQIAQGTYTDVHARGGYTQAVYVSRTLTLRGGYAPDFGAWDPALYPTVLDAQRLGRVFYVGGDASVTIEGLTMTGGDSDAGGGTWGGGLLAIGNSGPSLTVTLRYDQVISNHATVSFGGGGGLAGIFSNVVIEGSTIGHNEALGTGGGARFEQSNVDLTNTVWRDNDSGANGGALYALNLANVAMTNTVLIDNDAGNVGGALVAAGAYVTGKHTTVARNTAGDGSAIYLTGGSLPGYGPSTVSMTNSILVSHVTGVDVTAGPAWYTHTATLDHTLWDGGGVLATGGGNLHVSDTVVGTPAFLSDGYHLGKTSDAIDQGRPAGVRFDIDGDLRPTPGGYDLGADEVPMPIFLPLVMRDVP